MALGHLPFAHSTIALLLKPSLLTTKCMVLSGRTLCRNETSVNAGRPDFFRVHFCPFPNTSVFAHTGVLRETKI